MNNNNDKFKFSSNAIIYSNFVKYIELSYFFNRTIKLCNDTLYIFIDADMFEPAYCDTNDNPTAMKIAVGILNSVAHYRHYFKSRFYNVNTIKTFIISKYAITDDYHNDYEYKIYKILSTIVPFLPNTFYINSTLDFPAPAIITNLIIELFRNEKIGDIITISKNPLAYQIPAYLDSMFYKYDNPNYFQNYLIIPHKKKIADIINSNNVLYEFFIKSRGLKSSKHKEDIEELNPLLLPLIASYSGDSRLGMFSILTVPMAIKHIKGLITNYDILNGRNDLNLISNILERDSLLYTNKDDILYWRYRNNDIDIMINDIRQIPFDWSWYINRVIEFSRLQSILEKYSYEEPINLIYLFE